MRLPFVCTIALAGAAAVGGCASTSTASRPPVALAAQVDLPRFMGDWYVISNIPTVFEKGAYNAKDSYRLDADGTVVTTYSYNDGDFSGPAKTLGSRGFVEPGSHNAVWGQQYVWPFKADYRIAYVSPDYRYTVIAREKRDYVWIMSRQPQMPVADYERLTALVAAQGYDISKLQRVPQSPG